MSTIPNQTGKFIAVTGAHSGTGREDGGPRCPPVSKGEEARQEILSRHRGTDVQVRRVDLADLGSVAEFADSLMGDRGAYAMSKS